MLKLSFTNIIVWLICQLLKGQYNNTSIIVQVDLMIYNMFFFCDSMKIPINCKLCIKVCTLYRICIINSYILMCFYQLYNCFETSNNTSKNICNRICFSSQSEGKEMRSRMPEWKSSSDISLLSETLTVAKEQGTQICRFSTKSMLY